MLLSYLNIALRNLAKYKIFSFINIIGMAISLASCVLITLFVSDELQYDNYHPDGDRTYRVYNITNHSGVEAKLPVVPYPFASFMKKDFPEVESTLRIIDTYSGQLFEANDKRLMEPSGCYAEPNIFDMLTIKIVLGDNHALVNPNTLALSSTLARKYFGDKNPIGETVKIDHDPYSVTAVYEDLSTHSHLKLNYIISLASTNWSRTHENNWQRQQIFTYLKLIPKTDAHGLESKFKSFVEKYTGSMFKEKGFTYVPHLQKIKDIHLHSSDFQYEMAQRGSAQSVYILSVTAVMILVIACLNFVNLSTARSVKRMKEVGIRKVVGAHRRQLIFQFTTESILITFLGMVLAVTLAEIVLPSLNNIIGKSLEIPYKLSYVITIFIFCIILGIIAGSYPALHLSRHKPAMVLTRRNDSKDGSTFFRQSLVVLQFMFSFFLITGSWVVLSQNDLLQHKDLGFNKEQVVVIPLTQDQLRNQEVTKRAYTNHSNVVSATIGYGLPGDIFAGDEIINPADGKTYSTNLFNVDYDYIGTLGMKIIAGRNFSTEFKTDSSEAFILNETALKTFGFGTPEEALGKKISWNQWHNQAVKKGRIVGVVQDFNFKSLREKMTPLVLQVYSHYAWKMAVRIKPDQMSETIAHLKKIYESLEKNWIFSYSFLDENFDAMYKSEERLGKLFTIFSYLAILVACLGLFGLVEFSVAQRTKEICIRKVFGANVTSLLMLLTKRYFALLVVACLVVTPISWFASQQWLSGFAYHITIEAFLFFKAAAIIFVITLLTVSFQSITAALSNPAKVLKNE